MTLQQLKYVVTVAECGNITEAAKQLFVSQPTVTSAIHDLEKEMQIVIFIRTNKGVILSEDGERFLGHARQVLEQMKVNPDERNVIVTHQFVTGAKRSESEEISVGGTDNVGMGCNKRQILKNVNAKKIETIIVKEI